MPGDFFQSGGGGLTRTEPQKVGSQYVGPAIGWTDSGPPGVGYWHAGDILISKNVLRSGCVWMCISDGSPGTWVRVNVTATTTDPGWSTTGIGRVFSFVGTQPSSDLLANSLTSELSPSIGWTNACPDAGYWKVGDIFVSQQTTNPSYQGLYICIAEGSPGTWRKLSPKTQQSFLFGTDWVNTGWQQSATSSPGALGAATNVIATGGYLTCDTAGHMVAAPGTAVDDIYVEADIPYNGASDNSGLCLCIGAAFALMLSPTGAVGSTTLRYYNYPGGWNVLYTSPAFVVTGNTFNLKTVLRNLVWRAWVDDVFMGEIVLGSVTAGLVGFRNVTANAAMFTRLAYSY